MGPPMRHRSIRDDGAGGLLGCVFAHTHIYTENTVYFDSYTKEMMFLDRFAIPKEELFIIH